MRSTTRRTRIALFASAAACVALSITILFGNRNVGFGNTISELDQLCCLIVATALFALQLLFWIRERKGKKTR